MGLLDLKALGALVGVKGIYRQEPSADIVDKHCAVTHDLSPERCATTALLEADFKLLLLG